MTKPSIAELLNASGHTTYTSALVTRAMYALYGNVGANLDGRDWVAIMQGKDPLALAEAGLLHMYQDRAYLVNNTQHLEQSGYVAAQAEITYRQMGERLGFTHNTGWSVGTSYAYLGQLSTGQLIDLVPVAPPPPPPLPTISLSSDARGLSVTLNVAGVVKMTNGAGSSVDLGSFAAGTTLLTQQNSVKEGFLTLSSNGHVSAQTSEYVVLGTGGGDAISINRSGSSIYGNYAIDGGDGNDTISINGDRDTYTIYGGVGDDAISVTGGYLGNYTIDGGDGVDAISISGGGSGHYTIDGGADDDTILINGISAFSNTYTIDGGAGDDAISVTGGDSGNYTIDGGDGVDAISISGGVFGHYTIDGGAGDDAISVTGGDWGNYTIDGGDGADAISISGGGFGHYTIDGGADDDTILINGISAFSSTYTIDGGAGDDAISVTGGDSGNYTIDGGDGADAISISGGGFGHYTIDGGAGDDAISVTGGDWGNYTIDGGDGADTITIDGSSSFNSHYTVIVGAVTTAGIDSISKSGGGILEIKTSATANTAASPSNNKGLLVGASFDAVLATFAALGTNQTTAFHAYTFTYDTDNYLLVDNGGAGYDAAVDSVIKITGSFTVDTIFNATI